MLENLEFILMSPDEHALRLAEKVKRYRLDMRWTRQTLANQSGIPLSTLRHFENTGQISLAHYIRLIEHVGDMQKMYNTINENPISSIKDLTDNPRQRGSR